MKQRFSFHQGLGFMLFAMVTTAVAGVSTVNLWSSQAAGGVSGTNNLLTGKVLAPRSRNQSMSLAIRCLTLQMATIIPVGFPSTPHPLP
ncbi:hypothetical protein IPG36_08170 [bacterium]|nr:MAG: hypothetical protein IPG36_08170 [bacterium]